MVIPQGHYRVVHDKTTADEQDDGVEQGTENGKPPVPVRKILVCFFSGNFLKYPTNTQAHAVSQVVQGVRQDGEAVYIESSDKLNTGKNQVYEEGKPKVGGAVMMVMRVRQCFAVLAWDFDCNTLLMDYTKDRTGRYNFMMF